MRRCEIDKIRTENDNDGVIGLGGLRGSEVVVKYSSGKAIERK